MSNDLIYRSIYENAPIGIACFDLDGRLTFVNKAFAEIIGCTPDEVVGTNYKELTPAEDRENGSEHARIIISGEIRSLDRERQILRKDGSRVWTRVKSSLVRDASGVVQYGIAVVEEITELRHLRQFLESNKRFENTFFASPQAMVISGLDDDRIIDVSDSFLELMERDREEIIGHASIELGMWGDTADRIKTVAILAKQTSLRNFETAVRRKSGEVREVLLSAECIKLDGKPCILTLLVDITERKKLDRRLMEALDDTYYLASHDSLTGLANRAHFTEQLQNAIAYAQRDAHYVALHLLDLNKFKAINDTYGHPVGDLLLKEVAKRIMTDIRKTDTAARLGGDEFAIIQTQLKQPEGAEVFARRLAEKLKEPYTLDARTLVCSASAGIALFPSDANAHEQLIRYADAALYKAKESGEPYCHFVAGAKSG